MQSPHAHHHHEEKTELPAAGEQGRHSRKDQGDGVKWGSDLRASAVAQVRPMGPVQTLKPEAWSLWAVLDL